jgi:hypothetical protein
MKTDDMRAALLARLRKAHERAVTLARECEVLSADLEKHDFYLSDPATYAFAAFDAANKAVTQLWFAVGNLTTDAIVKAHDEEAV